MLACEILIIKVRIDFKMEEPRTRGLRAVRLGEGGGGALGLRRGQVLSQQGRHGVQYAVRLVTGGLRGRDAPAPVRGAVTTGGDTLALSAALLL